MGCWFIKSPKPVVPWALSRRKCILHMQAYQNKHTTQATIKPLIGRRRCCHLSCRLLLFVMGLVHVWAIDPLGSLWHPEFRRQSFVNFKFLRLASMPIASHYRTSFIIRVQCWCLLSLVPKTAFSLRSSPSRRFFFHTSNHEWLRGRHKWSYRAL
jgi:hypothetical protein